MLFIDLQIGTLYISIECIIYMISSFHPSIHSTTVSLYPNASKEGCSRHLVSPSPRPTTPRTAPRTSALHVHMLVGSHYISTCITSAEGCCKPPFALFNPQTKNVENENEITEATKASAKTGQEKIHWNCAPCASLHIRPPNRGALVG